MMMRIWLVLDTHSTKYILQASYVQDIQTTLHNDDNEINSPTYLFNAESLK